MYVDFSVSSLQVLIRAYFQTTTSQTFKQGIQQSEKTHPHEAEKEIFASEYMIHL